VRREGLAVAALALVGCLSCRYHVPPNLGDDVVAGCDVDGSTYVKVRIALNPDKEQKACVATVTPGPEAKDKLCVIAGGVVRFKVVNRCGRLVDPGRAALTIIQPQPKAESGGKLATRPWAFGTCSATFATLLEGDNFQFCEVPTDVVSGLYKYGLEGQFETIDPDVEVRGGR